jgi:hypothetical protein
MKFKLSAFLFLLLNIVNAQTPDWNLKFSSTVEKDGKTLSGSNIELLQGGAKIAETTSNGDGDFNLNIPPNGDYMVVVSYNGCNTKKFQVSTRGVPADMTKDNFKAEIKVAGVTMAKPLPTIDYSLLSQPMLQIIYDATKKKFTDDPSRTTQMLAGLQKIRDEEAALIARYDAANKAGDLALKKKECDVAKQNYENARSILPDEDYPKKQLELVAGCVNERQDEINKAKEEELAKNKLAEEKKQKEQDDKKAEQEKLAANKVKEEQSVLEQRAKYETDKIAKEKALQDKIANDKLKAEQLAADIKAKQEVAAITKEKIAQEKIASDKLKEEKMATDLKAKQEADAIAKEKLTQTKLANDKLKEEKIAADKLKAEKLAADTKAKQEALKNKTEQAKIAAAKAKNDKLEADKKAKEELAAKTATATEVEPSIVPKETTTTSETVDKKPAKHSMPQLIGADKYKETMLRANDYFKMKRYTEAKIAYTEALALKPNDPVAIAKLAEVEKLVQAKITKP